MKFGNGKSTCLSDSAFGREAAGHQIIVFHFPPGPAWGSAKYWWIHLSNIRVILVGARQGSPWGIVAGTQPLPSWSLGERRWTETFCLAVIGGTREME